MLFRSSGALAAALIFQMRAGSNFTARCQFVRHLRPDDLCPCCGLQEDEGHFIELCPGYAEERDKLNRVISAEFSHDRQEINYKICDRGLKDLGVSYSQGR